MTSEATMSGVISERALRLEGRQAQGSERGIQRELVQGGEISHGVGGDVDCVNKSLQHVEQTRGKWVGTSHIEVVVVPCGQVLSVIENAENSEGASWNMLQHSLLMATNAEYPFRLFIDYACSTIVWLLSQLAMYSRGEDLVLKPWVLFALLASDICCDEFHHPNHVEAWCYHLLNPKKRDIPQGFNTEVGEQSFQGIVKHVGPLVR